MKNQKLKLDQIPNKIPRVYVYVLGWQLFWLVIRSNYFCFQSYLCGYSKLVSQDAWHGAKDQNSIWSTWAEKTSKNCWNLQEIKNWYFSSVFWRFLSPGWSDWVLVFCSVSGILRHKFRVPTKGTLKTKIFWPTKGGWLSSEPRSQTKMHKNYFFKAVNPIPMYRHMKFYSKLGQFWDFCFFSTPY